MSGCRRVRVRTHPRLLISLALEEWPQVRVLAESLEDEARLLAWLGSPATGARIVDAIADALEQLGYLFDDQDEAA